MMPSWNQVLGFLTDWEGLRRVATWGTLGQPWLAVRTAAHKRALVDRNTEERGNDPSPSSVSCS
jgi:hypothetical protein